MSADRSRIGSVVSRTVSSPGPAPTNTQVNHPQAANPQLESRSARSAATQRRSPGSSARIAAAASAAKAAKPAVSIVRNSRAGRGIANSAPASWATRIQDSNATPQHNASVKPLGNHVGFDSRSAAASRSLKFHSDITAGRRICEPGVGESCQGVNQFATLYIRATRERYPTIAG